MFKLFRKQTRAERNEKSYRKWLNGYVSPTTNQKIELDRVFTDRAGNNYYVPRHIGHITRERAIKIEETMTAIDYGIDKNEIIEWLQKFEQELEKMPWQQPKSQSLQTFQKTNTTYVKDFLYRLQNIKVEDLLIQSGLYFFYIDGENPYVLNTELQQTKFQNVKEDPELATFFLETMEHIFLGWIRSKEPNTPT
jgi:hypothetical protein